MGISEVLKNKSIKTQLITGFLTIIIASVFFTILTLILSITWWVKYGQDIILPANYYEKKIPIIESYIDDTGATLLTLVGQKELEEIIPEEGIKYQVLDASGKFKYGTLKETYINEQNPLKKNLNLKVQKGNDPNEFIYYIPIFNEAEELRGAVGLNYKIKLSYNSLTPFILALLVIFSPFIYIVLLTILFASIIGKRISIPIKELIAASNHIKNKNLNFKLNYKSNNEIGDLIFAFEQMRYELEESLFQTWNLEQEKRNYITTISHDLKTPLTIIKGHSEGLMEGLWKDQELLFEYLQIIDSTADRMSALINRINVINELGNLSLSSSFSQIRIEEYFTEKLESFKYIIQEKDIAFKYSIKNSKNIRDFFMDSEQIHQVIDNILINSLRFTPKEGRIEVIVILEENGLMFHAYDSGVGFNETSIENIFFKFFQESKNKELNKNNSGLGLYSAKMIIEKHKGTIHAENSSRLGGAHVYFMIPNDLKNNK
ncbi:HAMP domain-containing sensor histidine kinase [Bacillus sp. FJAT-22090]|uniref:sensor histidine kinase n=1 Tax=Bacillus sp. FJAT-22090 TaxID=1581038 RepID=UPI0011A36ED7|nr:HAMP domain-containing sensor histidine kinase [Bacillus sp. FJAT-22090]